MSIQHLHKLTFRLEGCYSQDFINDFSEQEKYWVITVVPFLEVSVVQWNVYVGVNVSWGQCKIKETPSSE